MQNSNPKDGCMLALTEQFRDIFHPGNVRALEKPKNKKGIMICLRFHTLGFCFGDCKYKNGHGSLDTDKTRSLSIYIISARENRKNYQQIRNKHGNQDQRNSGTNRNNSNNTPQQPAPSQPNKDAVPGAVGESQRDPA